MCGWGAAVAAPRVGPLLSLATRAKSHMHLRSRGRRIHEPYVLLTEMTAAPTVLSTDQFVVVVAAAVARVRHPRQLHRVVEHRPHPRSVAGDLALYVRDVVHGPRNRSKARGKPVGNFVTRPGGRTRRRVIDIRVVGEYGAIQRPVLGVDGAGVLVQQGSDRKLVHQSGMPIVLASRYSLYPSSPLR